MEKLPKLKWRERERERERETKSDSLSKVSQISGVFSKEIFSELSFESGKRFVKKVTSCPTMH